MGNDDGLSVEAAQKALNVATRFLRWAAEPSAHRSSTDSISGPGSSTPSASGSASGSSNSGNDDPRTAFSLDPIPPFDELEAMESHTRYSPFYLYTTRAKEALYPTSSATPTPTHFADPSYPGTGPSVSHSSYNPSGAAGFAISRFADLQTRPTLLSSQSSLAHLLGKAAGDVVFYLSLPGGQGGWGEVWGRVRKGLKDLSNGIGGGSGKSGGGGWSLGKGGEKGKEKDKENDAMCDFRLVTHCCVDRGRLVGILQGILFLPLVCMSELTGCLCRGLITFYQSTAGYLPGDRSYDPEDDLELASRVSGGICRCHELIVVLSSRA
jgi:hypothetical protein